MAPGGPLVYSGEKEFNSNNNNNRNFNLMKTNNNSGFGMTGKTRKYPGVGGGGGGGKEYRMETMAESEGFGSSGRVDTEIMLSEDSCSPKRKCISLNGGDSHERFGVPVQVLSFAKLTKGERKEMEVRLKRELDEVRIMQRRVASFGGGGAGNVGLMMSPMSDIRSSTDGHRRVPVEASVQKLQNRGVPGSKKIMPGRTAGRNGPGPDRGLKKGFPGQIEPPPRQAAPAPPPPLPPMNMMNPMITKHCKILMNNLMKHNLAWVFQEPVDPVKLNVPDYFTVIKHPMDLGTVKNKLEKGKYNSPLEFAADIRLTFSNAMAYNPIGNDVHVMAEILSKHFEQRWKNIAKKIPPNLGVQPMPSRIDAQVQNGGVAAEPIPPVKKKKVAPVNQPGKVEPIKKVMTPEDKSKLSSELESLLNELPESIIDFLKEASLNGAETAEDEIEIDIEALSDDVLFKLRELLDEYVLEKRKHQTKAEPCEMELHNESGFSNSSIQPGKGHDAVDEDIDIGGNEHPVSSFPPLEIEKDTANLNSRCSTASSSSSDSDSDSGSSSSSDSDSKMALPPDNKLQGTGNTDSNLDRRQSDIERSVLRNKPQNNFSQSEQNLRTKPLSAEVDGHKEGESAPSERQVSPDKLYRAALLKNRFADTILKAQEKTLEKGEKRDPEKLRLEREELERRKREEKARLLAEAKAAEEARKKAEAEAAAEAKRKRETEREAARLALQKMEKTVDINENCQFLEDLEMLRAAPADNLSCFMDDASPHDSQSGLGSFRFQGNSNPLEQLGLYMKDDGDDEEEVEAPNSAPDPAANDVEEGEID